MRKRMLGIMLVGLVVGILTLGIGHSASAAALCTRAYLVTSSPTLCAPLP